MVTALLQLEVLQGPQRRLGVGHCLEVRPTSDTGKPNSFPGQGIIVTSAARKLIALSKANEKLEAVVVSGEIDPTLHPDFREITENLKELVKKWYAKVPLCIATSAARLDSPDVSHALSLYAKVYLRLEAGSAKTHGALGGDAKTFKEWVDRLVHLQGNRVTVQCCFQQGDVDNSSDTEVKAWVGHVQRVRPAAVQIWTVPKSAPRGKKPVTKARLQDIAAKAREKLGIAVEVLSD